MFVAQHGAVHGAVRQSYFAAALPRGHQSFLPLSRGKRSVMLKELRAEMRKASDEKRFEEAAILRDQVQAIERLDERERRGDEAQYDWQPEVTISIQDPKLGCKSLQRTLGLSQEIQCVEAIDIAHLGGGERLEAWCVL
ncbi:MAG: hypothetical protein EBQ58_09585 [Betaproteobacteria bacterium]|nr:hypothetical protein [Betaproteobacteria bacterium]